MKHTLLVMSLAAVIWSPMGGEAAEFNRFLPGGTRIAAVAVQNRSRQPVSTAGLDAVLREFLRQQGFDAVTLPMQPPADLDHLARQAQCSYILITDIVEVRKTIPPLSNIPRALGALFGVETKPAPASYVAEVEFRLFAMDEVLPRISTTVTGKTGRLRSAYSEASGGLPGFAFRREMHESVEAGDEDQPYERFQAEKSALAASLDRVARALRTVIANSPNG